MFCLKGKKTILIPLSFSDIDERIKWNLEITDWKKLENPSYVEEAIDPVLYREKKQSEITNNSKYIDGIFTSLEIYTKGKKHIGFINCYSFPQPCLLRETVAIGIVIPEECNQNRGFGTDALQLYAEYLFDCGIKAIYIITHKTNQAMIATAHKIGFMFYNAPSIKENEQRIILLKKNISVI